MRNYEKYKTAQERAEAFCRENDIGNDITNAADILNIRQVFNWLDLEAPSEKPLPCPFCRKEKIYPFAGTEVNGYQWHCSCPCGYRTADYETNDAAISAHNRVARAVMKKEANNAN